MSTVEVIYDLLDVCVFVVESFMKAKAKCEKKYSDYFSKYATFKHIGYFIGR